MTGKRKKPSNPPPTFLEWLMGFLGAAIILTALTVITLDALKPHEPARLVAEMKSARPSGQGWVAEIEVRNLGGETAAAVEIEGRLDQQTARATVDYVPARGRERVALSFRSDPRSGLDLSVPGWSQP
jgi:uncharacterized protein (TIGR02588 family)